MQEKQEIMHTFTPDTNTSLHIQRLDAKGAMPISFFRSFFNGSSVSLHLSAKEVRDTFCL